MENFNVVEVKVCVLQSIVVHINEGYLEVCCIMFDYNTIIFFVSKFLKRKCIQQPILKQREKYLLLLATHFFYLLLLFIYLIWWK